MTANDMVPDHYKQPYIHWDYVWKSRIGYFEGNATKYITRWRGKNGLADLKKALHYANKLLELVVGTPERWFQHPNDIHVVRSETQLFLLQNNIVGLEAEAFWSIACWETYPQLVRARDLILELINLAEITGKPVPLTEENHHAARVGQSNEG
jgi:hypothetical protein